MVPFDDGLSQCLQLTSEMVTRAEKALGCKLPQSYLDVLSEKNGGNLIHGAFPTDRPTNWANNHVYCRDLMGIGCGNGIDGDTGSQYLIEEWDYPDIGIVFSTDGHTAFMLDYSTCGPQGEPRVVYVETDPELAVLLLAPTFAAFVSGLVEEIEENP
jgi:hypothetical protein